MTFWAYGDSSVYYFPLHGLLVDLTTKDAVRRTTFLEYTVYRDFPLVLRFTWSINWNLYNKIINK